MIRKVLLLVALSLLVSCGTKHKQMTEEAPMEIVVESAPDADADGVPDFQEVEENVMLESPEPIIEESSNSIPSTGAMTMPQPAPNVVISPHPSVIMDSISQPRATVNNRGRFVYEIPNEMVKLQTYTVTARIARDVVDVTIYNGIRATADTIIRVSETMQVELIDPTGSNFKIVSQSAKQFIDINEPTTWVFFVTPLNYGESRLSIIVSVIKDGNLKQTVYNGDVIVKTSNWLEIKLWFGSYWQWFIVVLLIPLIKWLQMKFIKKKNE